jgi:hypothetical protein
MAGRSQRHMREFTDHYDSDSSGQAKPLLTTTITDPASGTTLNEDFSGNFSGYPRTYSGTNLPTSSTINATTGIVTGTVAASAWPSVSITVVNSYGRVTSNTFTWTVT